jgi:4-oxalocrotonate tautomerase family enzyme
MPLVEIKLWDHQASEETVPRIIASVTEALAESSGAKPENIWVIVEGVSPTRWGVAGKPGSNPASQRPAASSS